MYGNFKFCAKNTHCYMTHLNIVKYPTPGLDGYKIGVVNIVMLSLVLGLFMKIMDYLEKSLATRGLPQKWSCIGTQTIIK